MITTSGWLADAALVGASSWVSGLMPADHRVFPTGQEIAQRAQELKITHLALMLTLPSILHPDLPVLRTLLTINGQSPDDDLPVHLMDKAPNDVERLVYSSREILTKATTLRGEIVRDDLMSISMLLGGTRIGDLIIKGNHSRRDVPLLQFARH